MSPLQKLTAAVIAVLLIAAAYGVWVTEPSATAPARASRGKPALPASSAGLPLDARAGAVARSEEHTSELQSHSDLVCRLLLEKKKKRDRQIAASRARDK